MAAQKYGDLSNTRKNALATSNWTGPDVEPNTLLARPLSDIREVTEISFMDSRRERARTDALQAPPIARQSSLKHSNSTKGGSTVKRGNSVKIVEPETRRNKVVVNSSPSHSHADRTPESSSVYSIPLDIVPRRSSSRSRTPVPTDRRRLDNSFDRSPTHLALPRPEKHQSLAHRHSQQTSTSSTSSQQLPGETYVRSPSPIDVLEFPTCRHPRMDAEIIVIAPLFVGGGSVEGYVRVTIDDADRSRQRKPMYMSNMSIDLLGMEELVGQNRKAIFLSLATDIVDTEHPPPREMILPTPVPSPREPLWVLQPCSTMLKFRLSLPLEVGPVPFRSRCARIRYTLCVTTVVRESGKTYKVRSSREVTVLSTHDPEIALRSLPSPLTAYDEIAMPRGGHLDRVRLTAGLHRQVWVSGTSIFVDVDIRNESRKLLKKLELSVERDVLCYRHAAASTLEKSASQARIFQDKEQSIVSKSTLKPGTNGWIGAKPFTSMTRTCEVNLPRDLATIRCGKFFEVRFYLNITAGSSLTKLVSVQLPITLIHMNSLDVLPNAVSQVALAIEEKRQRHQHSHSHSHRTGQTNRAQRTVGYSGVQSMQASKREDHSLPPLQGRAFAAPRQQSIDRIRAHTADIDDISAVIDRSPRKYRPDSIPAHRQTTSVDKRPTTGTKHLPRKTPSSASLGAYTLFNNSNASFEMHYESPLPGHTHHQKASDWRSESIKGLLRLKSIRSFDSLRARSRSRSRTRIRDPKGKAKSKSSKSAIGSESVLDYYFDGAASLSSPETSSSHSRRGRSPLKRTDKGKRNPNVALLDPRTNFGYPDDKADLNPAVLGLAATTNQSLALQPSPLRVRRPDDGVGESSSAAAAAASSVVRKASLRVKNSIERGRFEFKGVTNRDGGAEMGVGKRFEAVKGWFGGSRNEGRSRSRGRRTAEDREGWL